MQKLVRILDVLRVLITHYFYNFLKNKSTLENFLFLRYNIFIESNGTDIQHTKPVAPHTTAIDFNVDDCVVKLLTYLHSLKIFT